MKNVTLLFVLLISMSAATSHAFCMKNFLKSVGLGSNAKTAFYPQHQKAPGATSSQHSSAVFAGK